jgi:hypothetical protein
LLRPVCTRQEQHQNRAATEYGTNHQPAVRACKWRKRHSASEHGIRVVHGHFSLRFCPGSSRAFHPPTRHKKAGSRFERNSLLIGILQRGSPFARAFDLQPWKRATDEQEEQIGPTANRDLGIGPELASDLLLNPIAPPRRRARYAQRRNSYSSARHRRARHFAFRLARSNSLASRRFAFRARSAGL